MSVASVMYYLNSRNLQHDVTPYSGNPDTLHIWYTFETLDKKERVDFRRDSLTEEMKNMRRNDILNFDGKEMVYLKSFYTDSKNQYLSEND